MKRAIAVIAKVQIIRDAACSPESRDRFGRHVAGDAFHEGEEVAVAVLHDLPDLRVVTSHVSLHLREQVRPAGPKPLHVSISHRLQRVHPPPALRRAGEELVCLAEAAVADGDEERLLRPEEAEDVRLRDAGAAGDVLGRRSVEPALGELLERRLEDLLVPLVLRLPLLRDHEACRLVLTHYLVKPVSATVAA
jgi:hypothetical protein